MGLLEKVESQHRNPVILHVSHEESVDVIQIELDRNPPHLQLAHCDVRIVSLEAFHNHLMPGELTATVITAINNFEIVVNKCTLLVPRRTLGQNLIPLGQAPEAWAPQGVASSGLPVDCAHIHGLGNLACHKLLHGAHADIGDLNALFPMPGVRTVPVVLTCAAAANPFATVLLVRRPIPAVCRLPDIPCASPFKGDPGRHMAKNGCGLTAAASTWVIFAIWNALWHKAAGSGTW